MNVKQESPSQSPAKQQYVTIPANLQHTVKQFYSDMYNYFGDSLSMRLPDLTQLIPFRTKVFVPKVKEHLISLADPNTSKSGEELLEDLMEQARLQEIRDKERKERERVEFEKQEVIRRKIEEKRRILRQQTEKEDRIKREAIEKLEEQLQQEKMRVIEAKMAEQAEQRRQQRMLEGRRGKRMLEDPELLQEILGEEGLNKERSLRKRTEVKYAESSDSDEETPRPPVLIPFSSPAPGTSISQQMAMSSTPPDPNKPLKLKIVKSSGLKFQITNIAKDDSAASRDGKGRSPSSIYGTPPHRDPRDSKSGKSYPTPPHYATPPHEIPRDFKQAKKRKQSMKSPASSFDAYEFIDSEPEDVKQIPFKQQHYSSEGESSDNSGHRKPLTLKLKVEKAKEFKSD